ncbi:MAG: PBP1A family penicillin-binding protein [Candidatus Zixiibacteriota bacterium]|nr:MAG: PBP1A family penicillin-binding protein [candidate division Zixibacteria bacterium]
MAYPNVKNRFPHKQTGRRWRRWAIIIAAVLVLIVAAGAIRTYKIYTSELPSFEQLHNIEPRVNTKIYDRNGTLLKEYYAENRALTPFRDMPPHLVGMLIASEDQEFYSHWGINLRRIAIVALNNIIHWRITAGASTITQQLARMLFLNREQTLSRKIKEALTAIKLERTYSKDEIIEMYLNQHYFSRGAYGVAAAARLIFNKKVSELNYNDCAILIGMLKGPNINSPLNNPDKAVKARNRVLYSYYTNGGITREQFDSLKNAPLEISPPEENIGIAPYFTEEIRKYILNKYGEKALYSGGLKVYTSLDAGLQKAAEAAVRKKVDSLRARIERKYPLSNPHYTMFLPDTVDQYGDSIRVHKKVQGALVAIDNSNGDVLAMVGGRSWEESKFNRATQALRQPGSSFKPFVYTACIDNGYHTTDIVDDNPIVLDIPGAKQWRPHNFDNKFLGPITIRDGLRMSRNLVAIRLLLKISPEEAIFYARRMGITTPLKPVPSLAIGSSETKLIEMVSAYSVFPNQGIRIPYRLIHKIVDRYGKVLEDDTPVKKEEVLSAQTAYIMVSMMQSVVNNGTGRRARWMGFTRPAGGKTGTSDNFADNWFIGYTPQITAGVWVGFDDKTSLGRNQDGSKNGVPIWAEFMMAAHDSLPIMDFKEPEGIVHLDVCLESGEIATDRCVKVRNEVFIAGTEPTTTCHLHPSSGLYTGNPLKEEQLPEDTTDERTHF